MKHGLSQSNIDKIQSVLKQFPTINVVLIYGSRAKGNFKPGSDIDLAIKSTSFNLPDQNRLTSMLDDLNLPYTFDICHFESLTNSEFIDHINRVGIVFYQK